MTALALVHRDCELSEMRARAAELDRRHGEATARADRERIGAALHALRLRIAAMEAGR